MNNAVPFEWIAAVRFLREGRLQTAFIILGITIGVAVIVFMSALLSGLQVNFLDRVLTSSAQIQLLPLDQVARPLFASDTAIEDATVQRPTQRIVSISQWQKVRDRVAQMPGVRLFAETFPRLSYRGGGLPDLDRLPFGVIRMTGEGIVLAVPDRAWVTITAESRAGNPRDAQRRNVEAMTPVLATLYAVLTAWEAGVPAR